jgi:mediator of RNA polymerase II transcription subunit 31
MSGSDEFRFFQEAEFVQSLSNIDYVTWLAKQGYFEDAAFLNFLQYLQYFQLPEYAVHLTYHRGVEVLGLLLNEQVRSLLVSDPLTFRRILMDQLWSSWARKPELN